MNVTTIVLIFTLVSFLSSAQVTYSVYKSPRFGFQLRYPSTWEGGGTDVGFYMRNFPKEEQVHGVVVPKNGAEITVLSGPADMRDRESWEKRDLINEPALYRREVPVDKKNVHGCSDLTEVAWRWEAGPGAYFRETAFYCVGHGQMFRIRLTHRQGNPQSEQLRRIAEEMARSFQIP